MNSLLLLGLSPKQLAPKGTGRLGPGTGLGGSSRVPRHEAARNMPYFRRGREAEGTEVGKDQKVPGLGPGASASPYPQCPEVLACILSPAHLASTRFLCAQVSPLPKPGLGGGPCQLCV